MELRLESEKPIYVQLCEWLSDMIISGTIPEGEQIPSTTEISVEYKVNPATALKGINMLVEKLKAERQQDFQQTYVDKMCAEAKKLGISKNEIIAMIERGFENE